MTPPPPRPILSPYTTLFRSESKLHPSVLAKIPVETELISKLREHPLVDIFEPNVTGRHLNTTWNIDRVNAPAVWNQTTGSGAKLLIIDSGIDTNHHDLNPAVVRSEERRVVKERLSSMLASGR